MLIRLLVKNLFSFGELTEFNMLPGRSNRLANHILKAGNLELLKLNAIYGANGAGKSKLIQALDLLKNFVIKGTMPIGFITETFKFVENSRLQDVYMGVEFIKNEVPFFYGITINQGIIIEEELLISGLDKKEDKVLFRRTDKVEQQTLDIYFHDDILSNAEAALFPAFLKNELLQRNQPVLFYMKNRQSTVFNSFKIAAEWFEKDLVILLPDSKSSTTGLLFSSKIIFDFAVETMRSFNTGIDNIKVETIPAEEYFGQDDKHLIDVFTSQLKATSRRWKIIDENTIDSVFTIENDKPVVKKVAFYHKEDDGKIKFELSQESDGTKRLFDYIPVLFSLLYFDTVFFIDEIERSIHPLLIKELIKKFSLDAKTKGQLIFSTHESNLLDQDLFRPDEIWFAEKNKQGATELFPLSDFKEHHTIDVRKGYLTGRYGAIPFLSNLKDLNWDKYAETK
jgi:uncharacterized protein